MGGVGRLDESATGVDCYEYLLRIALAGGSLGSIDRALGVHDRGTDSLSRGQLLPMYSLRFFKGFAKDHPEYADHWRFRIREYERALIRRYLKRIDDRRRPLSERLDALYVDPVVAPQASIRTAFVMLLPPSVGDRLRAAYRHVRTAA